MTKPYFVVVKDDDRRVFSVHGPMSDDRAITDAAVRAQVAGRHVNCWTEPERLTRAQIPSHVQASFPGIVEVPSVL